MKTEVIMKRELFGSDISQKSKSEFFSATELVRAGNKWRVSQGLDFFVMSEWLRNKTTKEFINQLEIQTGKDVIISGRGRGNHTWVHPFLFIDMALAISPNLKIEVYSWLFDKLIKYRNYSGNSYKKMCGALWENSKNKSNFKNYIVEVANKIKIECEVKDWETATEKQLKLRDKIHDNVFLLTDVLKDNEQVVRLAIEKTNYIYGSFKNGF